MGRRRARHRVRPARGPRVVRATGVILVCGGVALALTVFGPDFLDRSTARADQRFVAAVQSPGRSVAQGTDEVLVIQAAHKVCDQRSDITPAQRRASTLTENEIDAVQRTFGDDSPAFISVAKRSYCPLGR